mgnify:FL=1|tara:strand:+ start:2301 stop:3371 length:1071 start_codon:yes stop_codon:yes gene_type:complete
MLILFILFFIGANSFHIHKKLITKKLYGNSPKFWDVLSDNLKQSARNWFIQRAERTGIDWNAITNRYQKDLDKLEDIYNIKKNSSITYPSYYTRPFHGYDDGNLNWLAAVEGEAATLSMAVNYWKNNNPQLTEQWLRYNISDNIKEYIRNVNGNKPEYILDVGSSVGISTEYLYKSFEERRIVEGLDLSPYFVALATYRAKEENMRIFYYHQNAETPLTNYKYDLIVCNFILHEVPKDPTNNILKSMYDLLNDGGVLAVVDLDPKKVKNNLIVSTFRKWAFEVTEPHIYEYYNTNMSILLKNQGFEYVTTVSNDPINTIWLGKKESKGCDVYECNKCVSNNTVVKKNQGQEFFFLI